MGSFQRTLDDEQYEFVRTISDADDDVPSLDGDGDGDRGDPDQVGSRGHKSVAVNGKKRKWRKGDGNGEGDGDRGETEQLSSYNGRNGKGDQSDIGRAKDDTKQKRNAVKRVKVQTTGKSKGSISLPADDDESEYESWAGNGQDDGTMDSDFEFRVGGGDGDEGVLEGFFDGDGDAGHGWGLGRRANEDGLVGSTTERGGGERGNKKGVDIDELIARRRGGEDRMQIGGSERVEEGVGEGYGQGGEKDVVRSDNADEADTTNNDDDEEEQEEEDEDDDDDELLASDGFGMGATGEEEEDDDLDLDGLDSRMQEAGEDASSDNESIASPVPHPEDDASDDPSSTSDDYDPAEKARREAFFAPEAQTDPSTTTPPNPSRSFQTMTLSRPILRGIASLGFTEPTPIQAKTIPVALLGQDVVGGAVTGSGKTAAFMIPILERLMYRPKKIPTSRVAILMPTRELAVQCIHVARQLAAFTDVTFCALVGGFSLREQENVLRSRPDVIVATPGRFIDHMRNSASFTVDTLEILVLDEADRMLEDGFADELNHILTTIPAARQTMLFSATMTDSVDKLVRLGLRRPVRIMVDARKQTVGTLVQEFVRLRPGREGQRLAYLVQLCRHVYPDRCIVFFRQKKEAHRVRIVFGLLGLRVAELHGSMSQDQRIASIEAFRSATVTHLLATDVASRGLDIPGVATVVNYEAPQSYDIYLHRVGRTARAGRVGRACTLAAEPDRRVVKEAVKAGRAQGARIVSRVVDQGVVEEWVRRLKGLEEEVEAVLKDERAEREFGRAEMVVRKGDNCLVHGEEILARPKRTWFLSEREKGKGRVRGGVELNGEGGGGQGEGMGEGKGKGKGKEKKRKLSGKDRKRMDDVKEREEGRAWKKGKGMEKGKGKGVGKGKGLSTGKGKGKGMGAVNGARRASKKGGGGGAERRKTRA